jgi:site-specific recombinase XerC
MNGDGQRTRQSGRLAGSKFDVQRWMLEVRLLRTGPDIRTIQELLGHNDVSTTMIYTHVLQQDACGMKSPLDCL